MRQRGVASATDPTRETGEVGEIARGAAEVPIEGSTILK
jgi:hypothetical protein